MRKYVKKGVFLVLLLGCLASAEVNNRQVYSAKNAFIGSVVGLGVGSVIGGLAAGPSTESCKDEANQEYVGFCSLGILYGMGIGAGLGYSLAIPVGGHFSGGLWDKRFAANLASIIALTGILAYADYKLYEDYNEKSLKITIPISLIAPHVASYLIGRQ